MAYRKYDTCFFERYSMLVLQEILGHKFDDLVNEDRPDLQSPDGHSLGIEVTRAMEEGRESAQQMLKDLAGITKEKAAENEDLQKILDSGYGYGLADRHYAGGVELNYWQTAKPMKSIIRSKVGKVADGFYGHFDEFGLFVFSKDPISEASAADTLQFIMDLQKDNEIRYSRLFIYDMEHLYACNLEDGIGFDYRISSYPVDKDMRKRFFLSSLEYS